MDENKRNLTFDEKIVADKAADDLLTVYSEEDRRYFFLILLFLICLIFLVSSISFAVFKTYYNGTENNVIDVNVNVDDDDNNNTDNNDNSNNNNNNNDNSDNNNTNNNNNDNSNNNSNNNSDIIPGSVLFSFNSGSNYIDMKDVLPTSDEVGKALTGDKQYFDFNVSTTIKDTSKGKMYYEIALVPEEGNTIPQEDVRVYLTEDNEGVSLFNDMVVNFSDLPTSQYHEKGRVIYRNAVKNNSSINYVFRMWLSSDAQVDGVSRKFGCKIVVDAYYR